MNSHTIALNLHSELKIPYYSVVKDQICYSSAPFDDRTDTKLLQAPASAVACIEHLWWSGPGLNRQPSACKADALPIELPPRNPLSMFHADSALPSPVMSIHLFDPSLY